MLICFVEHFSVFMYIKWIMHFQPTLPVNKKLALTDYQHSSRISQMCMYVYLLKSSITIGRFQSGYAC